MTEALETPIDLMTPAEEASPEAEARDAKRRPTPLQTFALRVEAWLLRQREPGDESREGGGS